MQTSLDKKPTGTLTAADYVTVAQLVQWSRLR